MTGTPDPYAAFRLNLEQQRKRAKDLVRARRARGATGFKLSDAQFAIARELGFTSWMALRAHINAQTAARVAIDNHGSSPDVDMRTLHIRCGSDIQGELTAAGFGGDFLSLWDPFPVGPVTRTADWIAERARFHADASAGDMDFAAMLTELAGADQRLAASPDEYARVVIWMEHDSHDQLALIRCLDQFARTRPPQVLELISVNHFPGSRRFIGLGQLPPEAMRLLWEKREKLDESHLALGGQTWSALTSDDPRDLASLMRTGTPALPHLAPALRRHLQELPSTDTGLSLTQSLMLQLLAESPASINELWQRYGAREPLPFLGDMSFLRILDDMEKTSAAVFVRSRTSVGQPFRDRLAITDAGRDVLRETTDWLTLAPPPRWVGGVRIDPAQSSWRWNDGRSEVTLVPSSSMRRHQRP